MKLSVDKMNVELLQFVQIANNEVDVGVPNYQKVLKLASNMKSSEFIDFIDGKGSDLSRTDFCKLSGIAPSTFSGWAKKEDVPHWAKVILVNYLEERQQKAPENKPDCEPREAIRIVECDDGYELHLIEQSVSGLPAGRKIASGVKTKEDAELLASSTALLESNGNLKKIESAKDFLIYWGNTYWSDEYFDEYSSCKLFYERAIDLCTIAYQATGDHTWLDGFDEFYELASVMDPALKEHEEYQRYKLLKEAEKTSD